MISSENCLTKKDFEQSNWQEIIEACDIKECFSYSEMFFRKLEEAMENNNSKEQIIYSLLGNVTSLGLDTQLREQPFKPKIVIQHSRSAIIEDISEEHIDILQELAPDIDDPEMRARVADILWIKRRNHRLAGLASESYIKSFENLFDPDHWTPCVKRIERGLQLAACLGKKNALFANTIQSIENAIDRCNGEDPLFLSHRLMELLLQQKTGNPIKYIEISKKMAKKSEEEHAWSKAREYWQCNADWHSMNKDYEAKRESLIARAETYVKESDDALIKSSPGYMLASSYLQKAIESLKRIANTNERVKDLHNILVTYQSKSVKELVEVSSGEIDITKYVEDTRNKLKGKSLHEALITLATLTSSPKISILREQVERNLQNFPFQHLFSAVSVNDAGKVIARQPSMISGNPEEVEAAKRAEMYKQAIYHHQLIASGVVSPAIDQILLDHDVSERDFMSIVSDNNFIPPGREGIYARGLYAGITGDLLVSTHLLIPQIEHSIRYILQQSGVIPSTYNSEGIQDEKNLNSLLFLPELVEILGEDLTFDLQGLLVEGFGSNLRNKTAHGLIDHNGFYSVQVQYLWWIIFSICCIYRIISVEETLDE